MNPRQGATPRLTAVAAIAVAGLGVGGFALLDDMLPIFGGDDRHQTVFALGLLVWTVTLLIVAFTRLPLTIGGWLIVIVAAIAGAALSLLITRDAACCMYSFTVHDGYPFPWRSHHLETEDYLSPAELHRLLQDSPAAFSHRTSPVNFIANTVFWASSALLLVVPTRWAWHRLAGQGRGSVPPDESDLSGTAFHDRP